MKSSRLKDLVLEALDYDNTDYETVEVNGTTYRWPLFLCFTSPDTPNEAIIAYKGTTGSVEWADNVAAAYSFDTQPQRRALEFAGKIAQSYDNIIVTGHSKGANKAMYVALMCDKVTRCVVFDGQGFSSDFYKDSEIWKRVKERAHIIKNYSLATDFVHILINQVPHSSQIFCEGYGVNSVQENHSPNSFFVQTASINDIEGINGIRYRQFYEDYGTLLKWADEEPTQVFRYLNNLEGQEKYLYAWSLTDEEKKNEAIRLIEEYSRELTNIAVSYGVGEISTGNSSNISFSIARESKQIKVLHGLANYLISEGDFDLLDYIKAIIAPLIIGYDEQMTKLSSADKLNILLSDKISLAKVIGFTINYLDANNLNSGYINDLLEVFNSEEVGKFVSTVIDYVLKQIADPDTDIYTRGTAWTIISTFIDNVEQYISKDEFISLWNDINHKFDVDRNRYEELNQNDFLSRNNSDFIQFYSEFQDQTNDLSNRMVNYLNWLKVFEETGGKFISGDYYNNTLFTPNYHSLVLAGNGDDVIYGTDVDSILVGDAGNDTIFSGFGDDWLFGEAGNDYIYVDGGYNRIYGGSGEDTIYGGISMDTIFGGDGIDTIYPGDGFDKIHGGSGDDDIHGGNDTDWIYGDDGNDTIYDDDGGDTLDGGIGDDTIYGNGGNDVLRGREGDDTLDGGSENDQLFGGDNSDIYYFYRGAGNDKILDKYGSNTIIFNDIEPTDLTIAYSGTNQKNLLFTIISTNETLTIYNYAESADNFKYKFGEDSDSYTIEDNDGVLSFSKIEGSPSKARYGTHWEKQHDDTGNSNSSRYSAATVAQPPRAPLVIDLGTSGISLSTVEAGVHFDIDKNGFAEKTGWTDGEDGFLVLDRNGNGIIDDGGELFSDHVIMSDERTSSDGFEALADLDDDSNGIIDENDSKFADLRVWIDSERDGFSAEDEIKTLAELGITSIVLPTDESAPDDDAVEFIKTGSVIIENGVRDIQEHWFEIDGADTQEITVNNVENDLTSFGNMHSLSYALEHDASGELQTLVDDFKNTDSFIEKRIISRKILYFITDSTDITVNSRGGTIDARNLHVLETIMGVDTFVGVNGSTTPNSTAASILNQLFADFDRTYFNLLNKVLGVADYLEMIEEEPNENGEISLNLVPVEEVVDHYISLGMDVREMLYNVGIYVNMMLHTTQSISFPSFLITLTMPMRSMQWLTAIM